MDGFSGERGEGAEFAPTPYFAFESSKQRRETLLAEAQRQVTDAVNRRFSTLSLPDRQDIVQEVLTKYHQALQRGGDIANPTAWLSRVILTTGVDLIRRRNHRREVAIEDVGEKFLQSPDNPEARSMEAQRQRTIREIIADMPKSQQEVLLLQLQHPEATDKQGAEIIGIPQSTYKSRKKSAQKELARRLHKIQKGNVT